MNILSECPYSILKQKVCFSTSSNRREDDVFITQSRQEQTDFLLIQTVIFIFILLIVFGETGVTPDTKISVFRFITGPERARQFFCLIINFLATIPNPFFPDF